MEEVKMLGVFLGTGVISVLITALFTRRSHTETVSLKYITEERAKWREKIKDLMFELSNSINSSPVKKIKLRSSSTYLKLCLNHDEEEVIDKGIIETINSLCENPNYTEFKKLEVQVAILLKHDWERAKNEAIPPISIAVIFPIIIVLIWSLFYVLLKDTGVYTYIQNIPYISGAYSELALLLILTSSIAYVIFNMTKKCKESKLKEKYTDKFNSLHN